MSDYERGRADERADIAALLRRKAREDDGDEDFARTTEIWAEVIECGGHEGEAAREREKAERLAAEQAAANAPDPNQGAFPW